MKYFIVFIAALAFLGAKAENTTSRVKLMTYNIRNGKGIADDFNLERTAKVILNANPEIVALQELDSVTVRSGKRDILGHLAQLTSMHATYAAAIEFQGGKYGIGVLSKEKPLSVERVPLPGREEQRVLLIAEFENYVLFATHFSLTPQDQMTSLGIIADMAAKYEKPLFLAGDLNFVPASDQYKEFVKKFTVLSNTKQATYPANEPKECIDYIAVYAGSDNFAKTERVEVVNAPVESDHRPIVAEVNYGKILRTNPYLQNPTGGGITILWQTNAPTYSWVEWGTDPNNLKRAHTLIAGQVISNNMLHKIRLNGVVGGRKYYYRINSREIVQYGAYSKIFGGTYVSPVYEFSLPNDSEKDFTALIFNDLHQRKATMDALMKVVGDRKYDFVIFNGDCVDDPSTESQAINSISYFSDAVGASTHPVVFMRGNHEIRGAFSMGFTTLFDYAGGQSYGAMNWGDTRIVMLDCGEDKPDDHWVYYGLNDFKGFREDQLAFLKKEHVSKEFKSAKKRVLIHHIPLWGLGEDYNPCLELWGAELSKQPYAFSIHGHTHQQAFHAKGSKDGNPFPVMIGGGPDAAKNATVMVMSKKGTRLTLDCYDAKGELVGNIVSE